MNTAANIPPPGVYGKRFLQIVPAGGGGVNDYAAMLQQHGLTGDLLCAAKPVPVDWAGYDAVLLQYSGYGYARRGAPLWVLQWLRQEKRHIRRLGVFFHELYAMGPPWRSEFWVSPLQRYVARELAALSDFWLTNRQASANWLNAGGAHPLHAVLPTSSGVGELRIPRMERSKDVVVFGGAGLRIATYRKAGDALQTWAAISNAVVHDIGPPIADSETQVLLNRLPVHQHGKLSIDAVSRQLAAAQFGLAAYPLDFAAKSSVIGAYCAHGMCPIILSDTGASLDGLMPGINCLTSIPQKISSATDYGSIALKAHGWYQPHAVEKHVKTIAANLTTQGEM